MSRSYACAEQVIASLLASGVTDLVLAPGSRSAPLALAAHRAALERRLRLHVRIDERAAGFLALGLAKGSGRCVPVVTTSGTAVGNLLPAVMEAAHARVPLLVISADRPREMIGTGANQTTWQPGIFGRFAATTVIDAAADTRRWTQAPAELIRVALDGTGPVHLNIALPEPLVPSQASRGEVPRPIADASGQGTVPRPQPAAVVLPPGPPTVVVCGDAPADEGAAARTFAELANLPLIAEPSSAARLGPNALRCGRLLLGTALADRVQRVVMFGHPTLSRPVNRLLTRDDVELIVVGHEPLPNPGKHAAAFAAEVQLVPDRSGWLGEWLAADSATGQRVDALLAGLDYLSGPAVAAAVMAGGDGSLVLGNSMAIRDADLAPLTGRPVYANRGLSGIDGTVSTAIGIALATGEPTTLLLGDLSFVHDANALAIGPGQPRPDLRIVVADDSGGAIFATLEYGAQEFADSFEAVFATPSGVDPAALARGYGVPVRRVADLPELRAELAAPILGLQVLVIGVDRTRRAELATGLAACAC